MHVPLWCVSYSMGHAIAHLFWPGALGRDQKDIKLKKKPMSKIFKQNFVCVLMNKRFRGSYTSDHMKLIKQAFGEFDKFYMK